MCLWMAWARLSISVQNQVVINVDFQEILNEIDMRLSKFNAQDTFDPSLRTLTGLAFPSEDSRSPEV